MKKRIFKLLLALVAIATTANAQENMIDGHEYVDLGLPSGRLWATCNVGATKPEEYGDYFAWGETKGYSGDTSDGRRFGSTDYKFGKGSSDLTKYTGSDGRFVLDPEDDAATANWGEGWRIPTKADIDELLANTTRKITTLNGVKCLKFTAKNESFNFIILPASSGRIHGNLYNVGWIGNYWSSSLDESDSYKAYDLFFYTTSGLTEMSNSERYIGKSVRPVAVTTTTQAQENTINGHKYVDLGLPSGTLWATCNVGANGAEEYGYFFAWGETVGYTSDTNDGHSFNYDSYKWSSSGSEKVTKYCRNGHGGTVDNKTELDPEDDAAYVNWGSPWRMPSSKQMGELSICTLEIVSLNGVLGRKITGPNGKSIFLPAAGYRSSSSYIASSGYNKGLYWTRSLMWNGINADYLIFNTLKYDGDLYPIRCNGLNVRPVVDKNAISGGIEINNRETITNNDWYSVDGRRLSGEPTRKGIYIHNGKKVKK